MPKKTVKKALKSKTTMSPQQEEFANALELAGLDLRGKTPIIGGQIHRIPLVGKNGGGLDSAG